MKSLTGSLIAVIAFFVLILLVLGSGFGGIEILVWIAALAGSITLTVRHHRKNKAGNSSGM
ncbi:hypothetical protein BIV25_45000 [Streptomyces sp. MUSC 14]|uniref:hypothetical protein n=1 Tax=Streptomyces sp. MUSC 14 TaxID=1354889 RepID=UPI0008F5B5EF|nr:hypothetical protein [Streptomyces sp. MUSC 14]OIJ85066.1 hypothetical protein BIV25_45000 [Streptomyces sp. MUSC 14]